MHHITGTFQNTILTAGPISCYNGAFIINKSIGRLDVTWPQYRKCVGANTEASKTV